MKKSQTNRVQKADEVFSLDQLLANSGGSIFSLARIAMLRATEIYDGSPPLVDHKILDKSTTIALREISAGKVVIKK